MSLIGSISRGFMAIRADVGGGKAPWDDFWYKSVGGGSSAGMRVNAESVKRLSTVIACVSAKARQLAMLPIRIYTDLPGGGKSVVTNHPLYDVLFSQPNHIQTAYEFKTMMQGHVELRGNAYAEKIPGPRGPVDQLMPMHPDRVQVEVLKDSGRLRYTYNDPLTGSSRILMQEEVFHLRDFSDTTAVGQSRISMACDALGLALAQQDYTARFIKNDASSGLVITGTNFKTKDDEDLFRKTWQEENTGDNRGKTKMLPPNLSIQNVGVAPIDAQLLESIKASDVRICSIFNVLPHLVGVDAGKSATYASVEQFNLMNAQQSVLPMKIMWEQAIQRDLISNPRFFASASLAAMMMGDMASRTVSYNAAIASGWMCPDDAREKEDMNPVPDGAGKVFWRQSNWAPLKQLTNPQPGAKAAAVEDDAEDGQTNTDGSGQASMGRLKLLASASADRCVRKEVASVRKLIERSAGAYEVTELYAEQTRFIGEVFHLDAAAALQVHIDCSARAGVLIDMLSDEDDEFHAAAQVWIENVAATEPLKLAALVVEGVR